MLYLIFIIEKRQYLTGNPNNIKSDFSIVKVCNLPIKLLLNFSFWGAKGNLITTSFILSNNHFGINSSSISSLNLKKVSLMNLTG